MSFNYRHNSQWQSPTVKRRENGQWVTISGGGGNGGGGTDDGETNVYEARLPNEDTWADTGRESLRDGTTTTITSSDSLQTAINNLNEGDTLELEAGTYTGGTFDCPPHCTIKAADLNNKPEITSGSNSIAGANYRWVSGGANFTSATSMIGTPTGYTDPNVATEGDPAEGDMSIEVDDSTGYGTGDAIHIFDNNLLFRGTGPHGGSGTGQVTAEWNEVDSVSGNTLNLVWPVSQYWHGNNNATVYRHPNWNAEDLRIYGVDMDAGSIRGMRIEGCKDIWLEDMTFRNGTFHIVSAEGMGFRMHNCTTIGGGDESFTLANRHHHIVATNTTVHDKSHRLFYCAGSASNGHAWNVLIDGVTGTNNTGSGVVLNMHWGNGQALVRNVDLSDSTNSYNLYRARSYNLWARDNNVMSGDASWPVHRCAQKLRFSDFRDVTILNGTGEAINFKDDSGANPSGPHGRLHYENIVIPDNMMMFYFEGGAGYVPIDDLTMVDCYKAADPQNPQESEIYDVNDFLAESNNYSSTAHTNFTIQGEDPAAQ